MRLGSSADHVVTKSLEHARDRVELVAGDQRHAGERELQRYGARCDQRGVCLPEGLPFAGRVGDDLGLLLPRRRLTPDRSATCGTVGRISRSRLPRPSSVETVSPKGPMRPLTSPLRDPGSRSSVFSRSGDRSRGLRLSRGLPSHPDRLSAGGRHRCQAVRPAVAVRPPRKERRTKCGRHKASLPAPCPDAMPRRSGRCSARLGSWGCAHAASGRRAT